MKSAITATAPGKIMIFGEHAVLLGYPCIVTAAGRFMTARATRINEPVLRLTAPDVDLIKYEKPLKNIGKGKIPKNARFVESLVRSIVLNQMRNYTAGIELFIQSGFSPQLGFGSSSASTVCTAKTLNGLFDLKLSKKELFDICLQTVLEVQGTGSGFDIAAAIWGGTLLFQNQGQIISPLKIDNLPLVVGYTGIKADTVTIINEVKERAKKEPKLVANLYRSMGLIAQAAVEPIQKSDWINVGKLMDQNQSLLKELGISSEKLDAMCAAAAGAGAYGAKLSGAGKGDCMIALAPEEKRSGVEKAIEKAGGEIIRA